MDTRRRQANQIHNTICFGYHYAQTNDVNKTWLLLQTTDKIWPRMLLTYKITDDVTTKTFLQRKKVVQIWLFVYNSSSRNPHNVLMFSIFPQWKYLGRKAYPNRRHYICFFNYPDYDHTFCVLKLVLYISFLGFCSLARQGNVNCIERFLSYMIFIW